MGDPKKTRRKYKTHSHPWIRETIERERVIVKNYGLTNKKEILKAESKLKKFKEQAKRLVQIQTEQARREEKQMMDKLKKLNLVKKDATLSDVLSLNLNNILDRRLQSQVLKNKLARTVKQARQFVIHGHIAVNGKKMTVPSYLIKADEEDKISYSPNSSLQNTEHPERPVDERIKKEVIKKEKIKKEVDKKVKEVKQEKPKK